MRRVVLADTDPLYAAVDIDDQYHAQAQAEVMRLRQEGLTVGVLLPILLESYSLVLQRLGLHIARRWLDEIREGIMLVNPTSEDYLAAATRVRSYIDQPLTLFDGVLAAMSQRPGAPVCTYDHHFDRMRVEVWR